MKRKLDVHSSILIRAWSMFSLPVFTYEKENITPLCERDVKKRDEKNEIKIKNKKIKWSDVMKKKRNKKKKVKKWCEKRKYKKVLIMCLNFSLTFWLRIILVQFSIFLT